MKPHPDDVLQAAVLLHGEGYAVSRIAELLRVGRQTVRRWVLPGERERHNKVIRRDIGTWTRRYAELGNAARALYVQGLRNQTEIARRLNVNRESVRKWIKQLDQSGGCRASNVDPDNNPEHHDRIAAHCQRIKEELARRAG